MYRFAGKSEDSHDQALDKHSCLSENQRVRMIMAASVCVDIGAAQWKPLPWFCLCRYEAREAGDA
jgi:hypothetical protein